MSEFALHFGRDHGEDSVYKLLELPKELVEVVKSGSHQQLSIRGREDDEAVLCTSNKTYNIRAVSVSNAYCILTPPRAGESGEVILRETVSQILELTPSIPKLYRIRGLLRDSEYNDDTDQEYEHHTLQSVKSSVQASDGEFDEALRARHILILNNELRPMNMGYLNTVLELILNTLVSLSASPSSAPATDIAETLQADHDVRPEITYQVMSWFGIVTTEGSTKTWCMEEAKIVRQLGIGLLSGHRNDPAPQNNFLTHWKLAVGDALEDIVDLSLLRGEYITIQPSSLAQLALVYYPSSELPATAAERFAELFLVQGRWRREDIMPFLTDIAFDEKEKDKLLMKYARGTKDKEGRMWYTTRGGTVT